jgi:hypothetical protein
VLRFWNNEVMENMEGVLERIAAAVRDQAPSPPSPLPLAGEGRIDPHSPLQTGEGSINSSSPLSKSREGCIEITPS